MALGVKHDENFQLAQPYFGGVAELCKAQVDFNLEVVFGLEPR
jgi:hypothetical protein